MPSNPTPSVGRIVHYMTRGSADGVYPPTAFAAIITKVNENPETVDLVTFGPSGMRFEINVSQGEIGGQWNWPPRV